MKKMKRFLVAMLGGLTAIACLAGISACKKDKASEETVQQPNYDININYPDVEVEKCVHDYSVVYADKAATCDEDGYTLIGCSKCGERLTESMVVIPKLGHDYVAVAAKAATCTEKGYVAHTVCNNCGDKQGFAETDVVDHTYAAATCTKPATCVCGATKGEALGHDMVYVFDETSDFNYDDNNTTNLVEGWIKSTVYASLVDATSGVINKTCTTNGMKQFKICKTCALEVTDAVMSQDEKLAWGDKTPLERFQYIVANSYTEGFEEIPASHNWVKYFSGDAANEAGEYTVAICGTEGLKNFEVCKDCAENTADYTKTSVADIKAMVTIQGTATRPVVYAKGFEEAITPALAHNYVNPVTGENTYKAGLDQTCVADGFTESFTCFNANCPVGTKTSTVLLRDPHDGEVNGAFVASEVENVNTKIAKCGKANYCGDCKTYWGTEVACVTVDVTKTANCVEAGYTGTVCVDCGKINYTSYVAATGHRFGNNKVAHQPATCTTAEIKEHYTCDNGCGATAFGTDTIDPATQAVISTKYQIVNSVVGQARLGHTIVRNGNATVIATSGAAFCGILVNDIKSYIGNTANNATVCTDFANLNGYSCSRCNAWTLSVNMHDATTDGAWYVDELGYPTLNASAYTYNNKVISATDYANLLPAEQAKAVVCVYKIQNTKVATCTTEGKCGICNALVEGALDHYFDYTKSAENKNYFALRPATCTANGVYEYFACTRNCGVIHYETSTGYSSVAQDANGNPVDLTKANAATYLAIKAHGHDYVDVAAKAPTCTTVGYDAYKVCKVCGFKNGYKEIAKVAHNSFAMGSCAPEVVCDKAYFVDTNANGTYDIGEVWYGCGATIPNTNHQPNNHDWNATTGECECCKLACAHPSYKDHLCTVCGKHD